MWLTVRKKIRPDRGGDTVAVNWQLDLAYCSSILLEKLRKLRNFLGSNQYANPRINTSQHHYRYHNIIQTGKLLQGQWVLHMRQKTLLLVRCLYVQLLSNGITS